MKIKNKIFKHYKGKVYDISVSTNDHSYIVNNHVVHNSAAGSLTSYLLNIVQIDPIKHGLLFERFLTEGRLGIASRDVTKIEDELIISDNYVEVETDDGEILKLTIDSELVVNRGDEKNLKIKASELTNEDEIIFI